MSNWDNIFNTGGPYDDSPYDDDEWDDESFDDYDSDDYEEGEDIDDIRGMLDGLDIPDSLSDLNMLIGHGADEALKNWADSLSLDELEENHRSHIHMLETIYDLGDRERIPGISRHLLSVGRSGKASFGSSLCAYLAADLKKYFDKLLFGLIDGVYLHSARSITYTGDRICVSVRFFWDTKPSPYPLVLNTTDIEGSQSLLYLQIGDLLEDLLNGIETTDTEKSQQNKECIDGIEEAKRNKERNPGSNPGDGTGDGGVEGEPG